MKASENPRLLFLSRSPCFRPARVRASSVWPRVNPGVKRSLSSVFTRMSMCTKSHLGREFAEPSGLAHVPPGSFPKWARSLNPPSKSLCQLASSVYFKFFQQIALFLREILRPRRTILLQHRQRCTRIALPFYTAMARREFVSSI